MIMMTMMMKKMEIMIRKHNKVQRQLRKLEYTKIQNPSEMVAELYAAPNFLVHKKEWPPTHLHQPIPLSKKWPVPYYYTTTVHTIKYYYRN